MLTNRANKDINIDYVAKGSGAGIRDFQAHAIDFASIRGRKSQLNLNTYLFPKKLLIWSERLQATSDRSSNTKTTRVEIKIKKLLENCTWMTSCMTFKETEVKTR